MIKVIENFLPNDLVDEIESVLTSHEFPWYWRPSTKYGANKDTPCNDFQFIHLIYFDEQPQSEMFGLVGNLLYEFQNHTGIVIKDLYKIKANLLPKQELSEFDLKETVHVDTDKHNFLSIVYYVSDSDGETIIYDENDNVIERVSPKKGTAVCFPSNNKHRATPPMLNKRRIVLNIVVEI
jgi:hypothetical protein